MDFAGLIKLVRTGDLPAVKAAIEENRDLVHVRKTEEVSDDEQSVLHCAAGAGHLEICRFLVDCGAEVYSHPTASYPPVFCAFYRRAETKAVVEYFLKEIPQKAYGTAGLGLTINLAARLGFAEIVRRHLERDPLAIHSRGWIGDTPLHWSSHNGHVEIVEMLLAAGADIEADEINCYGGKPLHWASESKPEVVKILLKHGAEVDSLNTKTGSNYEGITPLGMNVLMDDDCAEVTKLLLEAGADPSVTFQGKKLEDIAEEKGNRKILEVLGN